MRRFLVAAFALGTVGLGGFVGLGAPVNAQPKSLTWTAGPVGGGWYQMAGGFAELLREKGGLTVKVVPGGGTQNPPIIDKGDAEIGWGLPPILNAALTGDDPYPGKKHPNLRAVAGGMSINTFHFFVAEDGPYKGMSMDDVFRGKKPIRLAISPSGTSDEWVFRKVLEFYGTSYKDMEAAGAKFFRGSYTEQAGMFRDRNVDGVFTFLAVPGAAVTEASIGRSLHLVGFPPALLAGLAKYGLGAGKILAGAYPKAANGNEDVVSATMGSTIVVNAQVPDDVVYQVTRTINENVEQVRRIHASLVPYTAATGPTQTGVPLHPGAERYYKEKGLLK
jgi:TRAP transporter TAXI family solute receptor